MTFGAIDAARTGAGFSRYWIDTIAHNIANVNTVRAGDEEPFRARMVYAQQLEAGNGQPGRGVGIREVLEDGSDPQRVYDPASPLADDAGYVTRPSVDLTSEMTNLIQAQRSYQASLSVITSSREAYQSALRLGAR